jgi:hypothetical protein
MNQGVELNLFPGVNQTTNLDFNPSPNLDPYPHPYPYLYPYFHPHLYPFLYPLIPKLFPHIPIHFKYPNPYPYANAYPPPVGSCIPESYRLHLSTGPNFADDMVYAVSGTSWTPSSPLESGKEYRWGVEALSGGGTKFAGYRAFFTGPLCECNAASLVAPTLNEPSGSVSTLYPILVWDYPSACAPQSYRVDLSTDASFSDTSLSGGTGNPSTRWGPGEDLTACGTYFWRVAAVCDIPGDGTILGPFSETLTFTVGPDPCPTPVPNLPTFTPNIDASCRVGPDPVFGIAATAPAGEAAIVEGRNENNGWFLVRLKSGIRCWLSRVTGDLNGNADFVPLMEGPSKPSGGGPGEPGTESEPGRGPAGQKPGGQQPGGQTSTCINPRQFANEDACKASGCVWIHQAYQTTYGGGYCTSP